MKLFQTLFVLLLLSVGIKATPLEGEASHEAEKRTSSPKAVTFLDTVWVSSDALISPIL